MRTTDKVIKSIQEQIAELRCMRREPRKIYMNQRLFDELDTYLNSIARYPNELPTNKMKLFGLTMCINSEFPEAVVV